MKYSQFIPKFVVALDAIEQKGRRAAQAGMEPLNLDDFISWIDQDKDIDLAELMYVCYIEGYNAGKAAA